MAVNTYIHKHSLSDRDSNQLQPSQCTYQSTHSSSRRRVWASRQQQQQQQGQLSREAMAIWISRQTARSDQSVGADSSGQQQQLQQLQAATQRPVFECQQQHIMQYSQDKFSYITDSSSNSNNSITDNSLQQTTADGYSAIHCIPPLDTTKHCTSPALLRGTLALA
jgi:hypothetical protein